jgi:hypothetical protein
LQWCRWRLFAPLRWISTRRDDPCDAIDAATAVPNARLLASFLDGSWRRECPPLSLTPAEVARAAPLRRSLEPSLLPRPRRRKSNGSRTWEAAHRQFPTAANIAQKDARSYSRLAEAASGLGFLNWVSDRGPCPGLNAALTRRLRTRRGRWTSVERWRRYEPWRGEFRDLRSSPDRSVARGAGSVVVKLRTDHSLHAERRASYCIVLGS